MLSKQVDGIIYVGCHSHAVAPINDRTELPLVYAYCYSTDPHIPSVMYDDQKAAFEAAQLLIKRGHRNIGVITGQIESSHTANRLLGYQGGFICRRAALQSAPDGQWRLGTRHRLQSL